MSEATYVLSGKVVSVEIPDNHGQLLSMRERLKQDKAALLKRIASGLTPIQRRNIDKELSQVKSELSIVNHRILLIKEQSPQNKFKAKWKKRQQEMDKAGLSPFPDNGEWEEKYRWCLSLLEKAVGLNHGRNKTGMSDDELRKLLDDSISTAIDWQKSIDFESSVAMSMLKNHESN